MLSDGQLTAVIAALSLAGGAFVTFLKWAFGQWLADRKEEREERREDRKADRDAMVQVATALNTMVLKFDTFERRLELVQEDVEEISGVHSKPKPKKERSRQERERAETPRLGVPTVGGGYGPMRPSTEPGTR